MAFILEAVSPAYVLLHASPLPDHQAIARAITIPSKYIESMTSVLVQRWSGKQAAIRSV